MKAPRLPPCTPADVITDEVDWTEPTAHEAELERRLAERRAYRAAHGIFNHRDGRAKKPKFRSRIIKGERARLESR